MTDGLVKHEGVVSINGVAAHPSTNAAEGNMCMFFFVIFISFPFFFCGLCTAHARGTRRAPSHLRSGDRARARRGSRLLAAVASIPFVGGEMQPLEINHVQQSVKHEGIELFFKASL